MSEIRKPEQLTPRSGVRGFLQLPPLDYGQWTRRTHVPPVPAPFAGVRAVAARYGLKIGDRS